MVKASSSRACHVSDHAVHHLTTLLIGIEVLVDKVPQKAPALRNSNGIRSLHRRSGLLIVFQVGEKIANRGQSNTNNGGVLCRIDEFVNLARNKPAIEMNVMRIIFELAIHSVSKTPLGAGNRLPVSYGCISDRQYVSIVRRFIHNVTV